MIAHAETSRRLRVFARPGGLHSRAMIRIANAIERYAPASVEIVSDQSSADLVIFYPIGADWIPLIEGVEAEGKRFALVQCCVRSTGASCETWAQIWWRAECVWSYLDLTRLLLEENGIRPVSISRRPENIYYAPLGIDDAFLPTPIPADRYHLASQIGRNTVVTTGYVSGRPGEAISEVWEAALACGYHVTHVGGKIEGAWRPGVRVREGVSDQELRLIYRSAAFVASLRYVEGFELPALEGLACGATPILFDQPDLRHWYGEDALYLPEEEGPALVEKLMIEFRAAGSPLMQEKFGVPPLQPVHDTLRSVDILNRFSWATLAAEFWQRILSNI